MTRAGLFHLGKLCVLLALAGTAGAQSLHIEGRHFIDPTGRVVVLRGVNLGGDSKVPPFIPIDDPRQLDPVASLGFNCVRLVVSWEAIEPTPGQYDLTYLGRMRTIAAECGARGLYVIVDIHQDGFSRYLSKGSGDGFPRWAASPRARLYAPDNGPECADWPLKMALDPGMHRSFAEFYSDRNGVRTRYLLMVRQLARQFATIPMVIGYDLLNEPWGREQSELAPLYEDAAVAIRLEHPSAILLVEGHVTTNCGLQTRLPRPGFAGAAYAPHYYKPTAVILAAWHGSTGPIVRAFDHMEAKAGEWCVPLFVGEFGAPADARNAADYVAYLYDQLDDRFASGAQWNYTPHWNSLTKDGWNNEDFNLLAPSGALRGNFRPRAFPRAIAGTPQSFRYTEPDGASAPATVSMSWQACPARGETTVFLPNSVFRAGSTIIVEPSTTAIHYDPAGQILTLTPRTAGLCRVRVISQ